MHKLIATPKSFSNTNSGYSGVNFSGYKTFNSTVTSSKSRDSEVPNKLKVTLEGLPVELTKCHFIHSGETSAAYKYVDSTGKFYVVKFPHSSSTVSSEQHNIKLAILKKRISKPNLLTLPLDIQNQFSVELFVEGKTLKEVLIESALTITQIETLAHSIAKELYYLHGKKGVTHRDIHADNMILKPDGNAHLIDTGNLEENPSEIIKYNQIFTAHFPCTYEIYEDTSRITNYDGFAHDSWAFGCTLLHAILGQDLFFGTQDSILGLFTSDRQTAIKSFLPKYSGDNDDWRKAFGNYISAFKVDDFKELFFEFGRTDLMQAPHVAEFLLDLFSSARTNTSPFKTQTISPLWAEGTWV